MKTGIFIGWDWCLLLVFFEKNQKKIIATKVMENQEVLTNSLVLTTAFNGLLTIKYPNCTHKVLTAGWKWTLYVVTEPFRFPKFDKQTIGIGLCLGECLSLKY